MYMIYITYILYPAFLFYMTPEVYHRRAPTSHKHRGLLSHRSLCEWCPLELCSEQSVWVFQAAVYVWVLESSRTTHLNYTLGNKRQGKPSWLASSNTK